MLNISLLSPVLPRLRPLLSGCKRWESENIEADAAATNQRRAAETRSNPRTALNSIKIKEQIKHSGILDEYKIPMMYLPQPYLALRAGKNFFTILFF